MNQKWIFFGLLIVLGLLALWCYYKKKSTENYKSVPTKQVPQVQKRTPEPKVEFLDEDDTEFL